MLTLSTPVATPSQTSYSNPRQIVAAQSAGSTVMYTVPSGKKFQGTIHSNYAGQTASITPSGGAAVVFSIPSNATASTASSSLPLTLVAGSTVTNVSPTGNNSMLIGVETDA